MIEVSSFSGNFVQVPHSFLRDKGLSSEARFLGVYLASLPSNWEVNWEQVAYEIGWSYAKVRKVAKELIEEQILEREEVRDEAGRFCGKSNTKITYKQESLFISEQNLSQNDELDCTLNSSVDFSTDSSQNPSEQGLEVPTNENVHRVLQNPHTDFVQHKNKLFKEQRDFITRTREGKSSQESNLQDSSQKSSQNPSETYKIFNRTDLKLNIYALFGNAVFKSTTTNPQGLDKRGLKAWSKFVAYRRGLRAFSTLSKTRAARKFEEFYALGIDLDEAVEIAMSRGWFCFWDKQGNLITGQKPKSAQRANYLASHQNGVQNTAQNFQKRPALDWRAAMAKAQAQRSAKVANA